MSKNLQERNMHKAIKKFNKSLKYDVFDGRFWVREYKKSRYEGMSYFQFELRDKEQPERNYLIPGWFNSSESWEVFEEMNNFIITSNFWKIYRKNNNVESN